MKTQKDEIEPIAYAAARGAQDGSRTDMRSRSQERPKTALTNATWPNSTPTLKANRASGTSPCGRADQHQAVRHGCRRPVDTDRFACEMTAAGDLAVLDSGARHAQHDGFSDGAAGAG